MATRPLAERGAALLGAELRNVQRLAGGDLSEVIRIDLADGREAVVKNGPAPPAEAAMLRALLDAGVPAPAVLAVDDDILVMSRIADSGTLSGAWADLGDVISRLHRTTGDTYGWHQSFAFGALPINNAWHEDWPSFWAERRLLPQIERLPSGIAHRLERLAADLENRLPKRPPPALLHGDLWGGNVMIHRGRVSALIDPACYYGHAEVDLAMLQLFDSPDVAFHEHYGDLPPGADERLPIYLLWPAIVHFRLFGAGYLYLIEKFLARAET